MLHETSRPGLVPELYVSDLEASCAFYIDLLGFETLFDRPEEGFTYLRRGDAELMLDAVNQGRTWLAAPLEPPFGRGMNLQIRVEEVMALYERVRRAGVPIFLELEEKWYRIGSSYGGNRQFVVRGPDGCLLRFAQNPGARSKP